MNTGSKFIHNKTTSISLSFGSLPRAIRGFVAWQIRATISLRIANTDALSFALAFTLNFDETACQETLSRLSCGSTGTALVVIASVADTNRNSDAYRREGHSLQRARIAHQSSARSTVMFITSFLSFTVRRTCPCESTGTTGAETKKKGLANKGKAVVKSQQHSIPCVVFVKGCPPG